MSKRNIVILSILAVNLSGCASLNKTATKLGVNFWQTQAKKAPCKSVANLAVTDETEVLIFEAEVLTLGVPCIGTPLEKPNDAEIIELRGRYTVENGVLFPPIQVAP